MLGTACGRVESRRIESGLILWVQAVAAAEDKVVLADDDIDGSREERRGSDDRAEREELAKSLGLLVGDANGKV